MGRRRYTDEQKATALALYDARGAVYASSETGIPQGTIQSWATREQRTGQRTAAAHAQAEAQTAAWSVRRGKLGEALADDIDRARAAYLEAIDARKASDARTFGVLFGVLIDKADKLTGVDRARVDTRTPDEIIREANELMDELMRQSLGPDGEPYDPAGWDGA